MNDKIDEKMIIAKYLLNRIETMRSSMYRGMRQQLALIDTIDVKPDNIKIVRADIDAMLYSLHDIGRELAIVKKELGFMDNE